jgi:hypothetical protein
VLRFGKLVECGFDEVTLEMVYVTSRRWENKMKKLWLPVCLMVTATVFYSNEDNQFDATTTRMPTVRVTDAGMKTVVHREPGCTAVDSFFCRGSVGESRRAHLLEMPQCKGGCCGE